MKRKKIFFLDGQLEGFCGSANANFGEVKKKFYSFDSCDDSDELCAREMWQFRLDLDLAASIIDEAEIAGSSSRPIHV